MQFPKIVRKKVPEKVLQVVPEKSSKLFSKILDFLKLKKYEIWPKTLKTSLNQEKSISQGFK